VVVLVLVMPGELEVEVLELGLAMGHDALEAGLAMDHGVQEMVLGMGHAVLGADLLPLPPGQSFRPILLGRRHRPWESLPPPPHGHREGPGRQCSS
jgi:hypothetical protein